MSAHRLTADLPRNNLCPFIGHLPSPAPGVALRPAFVDVLLDPGEEPLDPDVDAGEVVGGAVEAARHHAHEEGPPEKKGINISSISGRRETFLSGA